MLFSVVIPVFNRAELLRKTLDSVWRQTFRDFEVIIVDDGSTDGTLDYLRTLDERVRVFTQANKGPGAARNLAAKHAQGEYLAFLDSDDQWFPWTLGVFENLIVNQKRPSILAAKVFEFRDEADLSNVRQEQAKAAWFPDYFTSAREACNVGAGMIVIRRDLLIESGGFLEKRINAEDHDLIMRLGTKPGFIQVLAPKTLAYRRHEISETGELMRTCAGSRRLLVREASGTYPGGIARARERHEILTRNIRPVALTSLNQGCSQEAWHLYRGTFRWHLSLARLRFLFAFPVLALMAAIRRKHP